MHQLEFDYLKDNHKEIHSAMDHLSFLPDKCDGVIGGIMFALSLDDEQRIKMASLWGKTVIEDAKNRLPHLKYLKEDYIAKKSLNINENDLESLISISEKYNEKDTQKYINEKTYIDMKIKEFVDKAISCGVTTKARHIDVIHYLFKITNYQNRYGNEDNIDSVDRDTIEKRYYRILDKDFIPTVTDLNVRPPKV